MIDRRDFLQHAMPTDWPIYVYPTMLLVSLGISYYLTMSEDLADATIALRTKERDEAVARQQATEAQLAALEARVQPHFLFNSLNSIAALIPEDADGAERMVERVSALLRSSLQQSRVRPAAKWKLVEGSQWTLRLRWVQASLEQRQRLQQLFFPEGIAFDGKEYVRTALTAPDFNWLQPEQPSKASLVDQTGIEPVTS